MKIVYNISRKEFLMKVQIPVYVVALVVTFAYGLLKYYVPTIPFTEDQIRWLFDMILALLGVDVVNTARKILMARGLLK